MTKFKKGDVVTNYEGDTFVVLKNFPKEDYVDVFNLAQEYADSGNSSDYLPTKKKPAVVVSRAIDGFGAFAFKQGGKTVIGVGCRVFHNIKEARKHWSNDSDGYHFNGVTFNSTEEQDYREKLNVKRLKATEKLVAKLKEKA